MSSSSLAAPSDSSRSRHSLPRGRHCINHILHGVVALPFRVPFLPHWCNAVPLTARTMVLHRVRWDAKPCPSLLLRLVAMRDFVRGSWLVGASVVQDTRWACSFPTKSSMFSISSSQFELRDSSAKVRCCPSWNSQNVVSEPCKHERPFCGSIHRNPVLRFLSK